MGPQSLSGNMIYGNIVIACAGEGKMFSPGNLRATFDNPEYEKLISYWVGEKYTLRYTGGMVPDVFQVCWSGFTEHLGLGLAISRARVRHAKS